MAKKRSRHGDRSGGTGSPRDRGPRHGHAHGPAGRSAAGDGPRPLVAAGFRRWLLDQVPEPVAEETASGISTLLKLRADYMDLHDPGMWTAEIIAFLLTELVPWKVAQRREDSVLIIPRLGMFFEYLEEQGQWSRSSMPVAAAHATLEGLELDVLEAADDPSRRSMSGNILSYAVEQGLDLGDPDVLNAYMAWYNSLPHAERIELSDTGRLRRPSRPFDPTANDEDSRMPPGGSGRTPKAAGGGSAFGPVVDAARAGVPYDGGAMGYGGLGAEGSFAGWDDDAIEEARGPLGDSWPAYLGAPPQSDDREFAPEEMLAAGRDSVFVQRALAILDLVGEGARATSTGALTLRDTQKLCDAWGLEPRKLRSMWDRREIADPFTTLIEGRWLEGSATRIYPGEGLAPACDPEEDPDGFRLFVTALLTRHFLSRLLSASYDGGFSGLPDTAFALMKAGSAGGLDMPDIHGVLRSFSDDELASERMMADFWRAASTDLDLRSLALSGVITRDDRHVAASCAVLVAMGNAMEIMQMEDLPFGEDDDLDEDGYLY